MNIRYSLLALCLALASTLASADLVVVANPGVKFTSLPQSQLNRLFMGQTESFPDGSRALPLDVSGDQRGTFYQKVLKKAPAQVEKYWARMIFTGKEQPPRQVRAREVKSLVSETAGAISYMDSTQVDSSVKVIAIVNDR